MSVDSTELRKSTLQRKDRDELMAIATALGAKPSSRARKAEIVDLILDTVGDGTDNGADEAGAGTDTDMNESDTGDSDTNARSAGKKDAQADQGSDDDADQGGGAENQSDQPEAGNRRRRRRGRGGDRDNNPDQWDGEPIPVSGHLDLRDEGYGFLRTNGWVPSKEDAYVPVKLVRQLGLRKGDEITGSSRPANQNEKNPAILTIDTINGGDPDQNTERKSFDTLTPVPPREQLILELADEPSTLTPRVIDLAAPVAKGQRGLVVGPDATDRLGVMRDIARSIEVNNPEVKLIVLLVDERPEDVIDFRRHLEHGEVQGSTFDRPADEHVLVAEMTIERAKRLVEFGTDVCVLTNGITRLARAYDTVAPSSGRSNQSAPIDRWALYQTKKFFGAGRALDEGGSLTLIGTAVSDGSPAEQAVLDHLSDTAGMELHLDGWAALLGLEPPVDLVKSHSRHLDRMLDPDPLEHNRALRAALAELGEDALPALIGQLNATPVNAKLEPNALSK